MARSCEPADHDGLSRAGGGSGRIHGASALNNIERSELQQQVIQGLETFQSDLHKYLDLMLSGDLKDRESARLLRGRLEQDEPRITDWLLRILGQAIHTMENNEMYRRDLVSNTLYLDPGTMPLVGSTIAVRGRTLDSVLNRAIGKVKSDLWPTSEVAPKLDIADEELASRCLPMLTGDDNADTVIREATTILEDRIRNKPSHKYLSKLMPDSANQSGEKMADKLFAPKNPVILVSTDEGERRGVFMYLKGIFAYPRNVTHHKISDSLEKSWAWSVVGTIDHILGVVGSASVIGDPPPQPTDEEI